jgi:hypothetical protein
LVLEALKAALDAAGEKPPHHPATRNVTRAVPVKMWRAYFQQISGYGDDDKGKEAERKAFDRGRQDVLSTGRASVWGTWAWLG